MIWEISYLGRCYNYNFNMKSSRKKNGFHSFLISKLFLTLLLAAMLPLAQSQTSVVIPSDSFELWENEVYEGFYLPDKTTAYYYVRVTDAYFNG